MVRHKNRWLLVTIELAEDVRNPKGHSNNNNNSNNNSSNNSSNNSNDSFPSKKDFLARLRRTVAWCFGVAGEGPSRDTQVRFCDAATKLAVVRVPREHCDLVRSALTLLLTSKQLASLGEKEREREPSLASASSSDYYCASVLSVHGSARTAKIAVFRKLRELYRAEIQRIRAADGNGDGCSDGNDNDNSNRNRNCNGNRNRNSNCNSNGDGDGDALEKKLCRALQERLMLIQNHVN